MNPNEPLNPLKRVRFAPRALSTPSAPYLTHAPTLKNLAKILVQILLLSVLLLACYGAGVWLKFSQNLGGDLFESRYSQSVLDRNGALLSVFLTSGEQWHIKSPSPVPRRLKLAVLTYEDRHFQHHLGVNPLSLARAALSLLHTHKRVGGSTITMQVVKLYTNAPRTYASKLDEIFQALALESAYTKDEILSMYLNNAPYGGNIIGFHAASLLYFGKDSKNLSWAESALLAVLPNAPGLLSLNKNTPALKAKRDRLLRQLCKLGYFDSTILELSLKEPLPKRKIPYINIAPHASLKLTRAHKQSITKSSIDKPIQKRVESRLKLYQKKLATQGVLNLAALVVDTQSGEIRAYVGSQDFFDIEHYGQIDGVSALRSPGSLLKPFLYALSIDEGLLAPQSLLIDVPLFFSNFNPQNANKTYHGLVPAEKALQKSLNVPFVKLLQTYGYERFFSQMQQMAGFKPDNAARYGLSFILGSKEMSLLQIARLYRGLGLMGEFGDIVLEPDSKPRVKKRFMSQGAAYLTLQTLKELAREGELEYYKDDMVFSWKSGTSFGRKDAWAAGVSPQWTIVVWAGNFTGEANANIFGVKTAGTLLFEILNELPHHNIPFSPPLGALKDIEVDKFSGYGVDSSMQDMLAEAQKTTIPYPVGAKRLQSSPFYHKVFMVDGRVVDSTDSEFLRARASLLLRLPLSVLAYYKLQNINITKQFATKNLGIIYPTQGLKILQPKDLDGQKELILRIANLTNQKVSWYLNKNLVQSSSDTTLKRHLSRGKYELSIVGEDGSRDSVRFEIE